MARYAIGDIQGCKASLDRLLERIAFSPGRDELWLVGDLVNRGPRSLDVLRWARDLGSAITCVLGNHDLHLLARAAGIAAPRKRDTLEQVLAAPDCGTLIDWLRTRRLVHISPSGSDGQRIAADGLRQAGPYLLVHAGLHPTWTAEDARSYAEEIERELAGSNWRDFLAATSEMRSRTPRWSTALSGSDRWCSILSYLVRARMLTSDGQIVADFTGAPADAPARTLPWFAMPTPAWTSHTVVFGHWSALGLHLGDRCLGIDTGCVWGQSLTAIRLDDRAVFQVAAVER